MAGTGLSYYYNNANLSNDDIAFYYNFNQSGDTSSSITGSGFSLFGNTGSFWGSSGSGFFSGTVLKPNTSTFTTDQLSSILLFEKSTSGNAVLISTIESGVSGVSGFVLGINDANKAYLTCYDSEEDYFVTNTSNLTLGRANGIYLNKSDNIFTLGKFNFFTKNLVEEQHIFPIGCNTDFSNMYLGSISGGPANLNDSAYVGYVDEFLVLNSTVLENSVEEIFKGFYKTGPVVGSQLISESDSYSYPTSNTVYSPIWEEMQSGALDYIRTNIFNTTGIGSIKVTNSGTIVNGTGYVSGNLSGTVSLKTGYYQVTTGSGITGYATSGLVASASGITGYVDVSIYPITVFTSGDIYQLSAQSGVSGVTEWESVFSGAMYETIISTGFVDETLDANYSLNFSYVITGLSGNSTYLHVADYSNNGNNNIVIAHDLIYSGASGVNFRAFKTTQLLYGAVTVEGENNTNFINRFSLNGITLIDPIKTGDVSQLISITSNASFRENNNQPIDLVSGYFSYTGSIENDEDLAFYINGVHQAQSEYNLENNYLKTNIFYDRNDDGITDLSIGINNYILETGLGASGLYSGRVFSFPYSSPIAARSFFFVNGLKLIWSTDYTYSSLGGGRLVISTNQFNDVSGDVYISLVSGSSSGITSTSPTTSFSNSITSNVPDMSSLLFYNRLRQKLNIDYIETSSLDIVYGLTGFYETNLNPIINI